MDLSVPFEAALVIEPIDCVDAAWANAALDTANSEAKAATPRIRRAITVIS
jgi:hypothetical protein